MFRIIFAAFACLLATGIAGRGQAEDAFYIQPYLQNVSQTGISILWWTNQSAPSSRVEYGGRFAKTADASNDLVRVVGKFRHHAVLSGLAPETGYRYRVRSGEAVSGEYTFHTAVKNASGFSFVVLGDGHAKNGDVVRRQRAITKLSLEKRPDLAIHCGDCLDSGDQEYWDAFWRRIATASDPAAPGVPFASEVPYYLAVGNHEIYSQTDKYDKGNLSTSMARFQAYVDNPPNGSSNPNWEKRYYAFTYGPATFVVLDTHNTSNRTYDNHRELPDGSTPDWEPGSEQFKWMYRQLQLARLNSVFTFVVMHPSPYCRGTHGAGGGPESGWHLRVLDQTFRQFGVDAVFSAHDHVVERCLTGSPGYERQMNEEDPTNLNYFVVGNSGYEARDAAKGWEWWMSIKQNNGPPFFTMYFYDWAGTEHCSFLQAQVENRGGGLWMARFQIVREDGAVFDDFSFIRMAPFGRR
jgi:hypothetical protein